MCIEVEHFINLSYALQALVDDLEGDTEGDFENLLVALVTPPAQYDCNEIKRAMQASGL